MHFSGVCLKNNKYLSINEVKVLSVISPCHFNFKHPNGIILHIKMAVKNRSALQKNVLTFYREYLKFANSKQDVRLRPFLDKFVAFEDPVKSKSTWADGKAQKHPPNQLHSHWIHPQNRVKQTTNAENCFYRLDTVTTHSAGNDYHLKFIARRD